MATASPPTGPARPFEVLATPQAAGDRNVHFVHIKADAVADLVGAQSSRVRVTLIYSPKGLVISLKGMNCFVAPLGGRPSPAVQMDQPGDVALVTPRAQEIGHIRVSTGIVEPGRLVFVIGSERLAVRVDDCTDPILFDFGPGSDAYFVYTRGRTVPRPRTPR
jgi:serine/threonine-protein kinase